MNEKERQKVAQYMKALGHPVRLQIVHQLYEYGACFGGDIAEQLPVAASTASQHLKILRESGVITGISDGPRRCYSIQKQAFIDLHSWLEKL